MKNYKIKTLSSLKRRVKKTAKGKYLHGHPGTNHNNGSKTKRQKRRLRQPGTTTGTRQRRLKALAPYK
jgi:ribosomal protein L35